MEYPCPKLIKQFRAFVGVKKKGVSWQHKIGRWSRRAWLKRTLRFKHHLTLHVKDTPASRQFLKKEWRMLLKKVGLKTIVIERKTSSQKQISVLHLMKMKIKPTQVRTAKGLPQLKK